MMGPWTGKSQKEFENYWNYYLPPVIWRRIMGLEETLQILTPELYEVDKEYLDSVDLVLTYTRSR